MKTKPKYINECVYPDKTAPQYIKFYKKNTQNILTMSPVIVIPSCILNLQIQRVKEVDEGYLQC